jgi:hypothetical protein
MQVDHSSEMMGPGLARAAGGMHAGCIQGAMHAGGIKACVRSVAVGG